MPVSAREGETAAATAPESVGDGVWRVTAGAFPSNAYLCATDVAGEAFVVDPGLDPHAIERAARSLGLVPRQVFCTHGHFDHIGGAHYFQQAYGAEVFLHPADMKIMKTGNFLLMVLKLEQRIALPEVTEAVPAQPIRVGVGRSLSYHTVPGHTPGSCFIQYGEHLFSGDSLYARGVGLSDLPGENHALLRDSLHKVWGRFADETMVHPGHGPSARFGDIRAGNRALLEFLGPPDSEARA